MGTSKRLMSLFVGALAVSILFASPRYSSSEAPPPKDKYADVHLNPNGFSPSSECGKCHKDIYSTWKNSLHAEAPNNSVFQTAYLQAYFERGEEVRQVCLACHAPIAALNADFKLTGEITREGINCDYCHSIAEVQPGGNGPRNRFEYGLVKNGPLQNVSSPVHKTRYNETFKESRFCWGCHEFETASGVKLIETYSEWAKGPYPAKGIHCQNCHMRKISGKIVAEEVKAIPQKEISSHDIAGGHSLTQREESIGIKIAQVNRFKQKVEVTVDVTNKGAGHMIPTGIPSKKIVLQVFIQSKTGEVHQMHQKTYQKVMVDANGEPVVHDSDLLLGKPVRILSDNRIAPLETRREKFTFFVPEEKDQKVSAAVFYSHTPRIVQPSPIHIKLHEVQQAIGP